jgi:outer membrane protein assembly factor BamA
MNSIDTLSYDYFIPGLNFEIDTRNIYWNPQKGLRIIQSINPMVGKNKFFVWNQSWSFYNTIAKNTTLAFNTTIQRKFGYKNNVWISYFGNSYNIRGWDLPDQMVKDNFRFGHNYLFSTLEIRRLISLMNKPKFGISKSICVVLFGDIGKISNDWTELNEKKLIGGTGLGIRIPIPVIQSLRIDIGWGFVNGEFNENCTFHFAIQQKF